MQREVPPVNRVVLGLPQSPAYPYLLHPGVGTQGDEENKAWSQRLECSHCELCVLDQVRPLSGDLGFSICTLNIPDHIVAKHLEGSNSP